MIERVSLFNTKREFFVFLYFCNFILFYSLLINYNQYKKLTRFETKTIEATVLKQYSKTKNNKTFQVLKLKSDDDFIFYTSAKKSLQDINAKKVKLVLWAGNISFYEYMTSFYAYSKIKHIYKNQTNKQKLNRYINSVHVDKEVANVYQALYTATPLHVELQKSFSALGVSHLLAISGFHLGVLSALIFFFLRPFYSFFQKRYFPYRNAKFDLLIIVIFVLLAYLIFLDKPPSLLRSFGMLVVGSILYDRGMKILSMQTLFVTIILLLAFFPKLIFSLGFWLSVSGVGYIFLFLIHFKHLSKVMQFVLVPLWVYLLMLPFSLVIFGNFSIYHPLSIIWTSLFSIFYPLSIALHVAGFGDLFDGVLQNFISLGTNPLHVELGYKVLALHVGISLLSIFYKKFIWLLIFSSFFLFVYAVYNMA